MKIIAYKNQLYNDLVFLHNIQKKEYIHGIMLNITSTKDHVIVAFNENILNTISLETIQNSLFKDLQYESIMELKYILDSYRYINKNIYLKISSLVLPILTESTHKEILLKNTNYIQDILNTIKDYTFLPLSFYSSNKDLINQLKQENIPFPIGLELSYDDLSFIDLDFYILLPNMYNPEILQELLLKNKKIIFNTVSEKNISLFYETHQKDPLKKEDFDKLYFLSDFPDILYRLFREETRNFVFLEKQKK